MKTNQNLSSVPIWKRAFPDGEPEIPQPGSYDYRRHYGRAYRALPVLFAVVVLFGNMDVVQWYTRGMELPLPDFGAVFVVVFGFFSLSVELLAWRLGKNPGPPWLTTCMTVLRKVMLLLIAIELFLIFVWIT